jgi:hypothetical protein
MEVGVTGREAIESVTGGNADLIADGLARLGFVCVPLQPTKDMLDAAWADALEEDANGVWRTMIGVSEGLLTREGIPK